MFEESLKFISQSIEIYKLIVNFFFGFVTFDILNTKKNHEKISLKRYFLFKVYEIVLFFQIKNHWDLLFESLKI